MSTVALTQAQATRKEIETEYSDAYVFDADGTVRRIEHIEVLGPWGESWLRQVISRLTGGWRIQIRMSDPLPWDLEQLKDTLQDCLNANALNEDDSSEERARALVSIRTARQAVEIFAALRLPAPEDALDVL